MGRILLGRLVLRPQPLFAHASIGYLAPKLSDLPRGGGTFLAGLFIEVLQDHIGIISHLRHYLVFVLYRLLLYGFVEHISQLSILSV